MSSYVWLTTVAAVFIAGVAYLARPHSTHAPTTTNARPVITIVTDDGVALSAQLTLPIGSTKVPAVILIHDFGADRHQWDESVQKFMGQGFAVLSYDIRGFGGSKLKNVPSDQAAWFNTTPKDLPAIIAYLKTKTRIDQSRMNIVGVGLGANIAFVATGSIDGIHRAVVISPSVATGVLDGTGIEKFSPKNILGVAGTTGQKDLGTVMARISGDHDRLDVDSPDAGIALVTTPGTMAHIMDWIKS